MDYDSVLLIAYGGPEKMEDVRPFLANVLRGRPVPPERVEEVVRHYEAVGGRSPLNELTFRQAHALETELRTAGLAMSVHVGMRNWPPFLSETLAEMHEAGLRRTVGFIMAAHQSEATWGRYKDDVAHARGELENKTPLIDFAPEWYSHPLFIEALAERLTEALDTIAPERRAATRVVFTAHSIPDEMAAQEPYALQISKGARLVVERLGLADHTVAYQSRSGNPRKPWLEPDIKDLIRNEASGGTRDLAVVPIGFLCDHVEVLYDLDIEAKGIADSLGINLVRAPTVGEHPSFIRMMAEVIQEHVWRCS